MTLTEDFRALGVSIHKSPRFPLRESLKLAQEAEEAGFGIVTSGEGPIENYSMMGALALATRKVELISAIATWTRTPVTAGIGALTLADLSNGRYRAGLGPMPKHWSEKWHGVDYASPTGRMRDYLAALRAVTNTHIGDTLDFEGKYYQVREFQPLVDRTEIVAPPIYLAVTGKKMAGLAGEAADGVIVNTMTSLPWIRDVLGPAMKRGRELAGNSLPKLDIGVMRICEIDDDAERAREVARRTLSFYFQVPYFREQLLFMGLGADAEKGYQAAEREDVDAMAAAVSDEMLDAMTLTGGADDVRAQLREYKGMADWVLLISDLRHVVSDPMLPTRRIIATFAGH